MVCGVPLVSRAHTGSAFILMVAFSGSAPSTVTLPVTVAVVAGSIFCPDPLAVAVAGADPLDWFAGCPPPHDATTTATDTQTPDSHPSRTRINFSRFLNSLPQCGRATGDRPGAARLSPTARRPLRRSRREVI